MRQGPAWVVAAALFISACGFKSYEEKLLGSEAYVAGFEIRSLSSPALAEPMASHGWPVDRWNPSRLEAAAVFFNPAMAEARARITVAEAGELTAAARPRAGAGFAVEHHSDTSGDRTPWSAGPQIEIPIEGPGKRSARAQHAAARTAAARIDLEQKESELRHTVRAGCVDVYEAETQAENLRARTALLQEGVRLLDRRRELGLASDFEVSLMRLDAQRTVLDRGTAYAHVAGTRAALASTIGVPLAALDAATLDFTLFDQPPAADAAAVDELQRTALARRGDVRRAVQEYAISEAALRREIAGQYPDFVLAPGYFFDQADNIWSLATNLVLPLFDRNRGPIAEAEARRELAARQAEQLQAMVIGEVHAAAAAHAAALQLLAETDAIISGTTARDEQMKKQFETGQADRLEVVRAGLEHQDALMIRRRFLAEAWRSLFQLERATQSLLHEENAQ